jgi:hypothetical protein
LTEINGILNTLLDTSSTCSGTWYKLLIRAVSPAGSTQAEYLFATLNPDGSTIAPLAGQPDASAQADLVGGLRTQLSSPQMLRKLHVLLPSACAALLLMLVVLLLRSLRNRLGLPTLTSLPTNVNGVTSSAIGRALHPGVTTNRRCADRWSNAAIHDCIVGSNCALFVGPDMNASSAANIAIGSNNAPVSTTNSGDTVGSACTSGSNSAQMLLVEPRYSLAMGPQNGSDSSSSCNHLDSQLAYACTHLPTQLAKSTQMAQNESLLRSLENAYEDCSALAWAQMQSNATNESSSKLSIAKQNMSSFRPSTNVPIDNLHNNWRFT